MSNGMPQSLAHGLQFEWHGRVNRWEHSRTRGSGNIGKLSTRIETRTGQDVAWSSKIRRDGAVSNVRKVGQDPGPTKTPVPDESLGAYDRDIDSIGFESPLPHPFVVLAADQIEHAVNR
jgi:hypothetical protein